MADILAFPNEPAASLLNQSRAEIDIIFASKIIIPIEIKSCNHRSFLFAKRVESLLSAQNDQFFNRYDITCVRITTFGQNRSALYNGILITTHTRKASLRKYGHFNNLLTVKAKIIIIRYWGVGQNITPGSHQSRDFLADYND